MSAMINILNTVPRGRMINIIGGEICDAISNYSSIFGSSSLDLEKIFLSRYGGGFLLNKKVYDSVIQWLPPDDALKVCNRVGINARSGEHALQLLAKIHLSRKGPSFQKDFAIACGLDLAHYGNPNDYIGGRCCEYLKPQKVLHDFQKQIKDKIIQFLLNVQT